MANDPASLRLYLDEDIYSDLAGAIRQQGFDCESAVEARMLGKSDEDQLAYAASQGRCLLSFNAKDYYVLAQQWADAGREHIAGTSLTIPGLSHCE